MLYAIHLSTTIYCFFYIFYILLTVHHVMILVKWTKWRTVPFYVYIYIFNSLHVSSTSCSSSGETNCVNTTSGSCHSVSVAVSCAGRKFDFLPVKIFLVPVEYLFRLHRKFYNWESRNAILLVSICFPQWFYFFLGLVLNMPFQGVVKCIK